MNNPAGLTLPRVLRNIIRGGSGGDCKVGKVTLYVLRIENGTVVCWVSGGRILVGREVGRTFCGGLLALVGCGRAVVARSTR